MAATIDTRISNAPQIADAPSTIPSPAQVRATAAQIRQAWTPGQRRRRAKLARAMLWQQFVADAPTPKSPSPRS